MRLHNCHRYQYAKPSLLRYLLFSILLDDNCLSAMLCWVSKYQQTFHIGGPLSRRTSRSSARPPRLAEL
jgi:hypothetical protein